MEELKGSEKGKRMKGKGMAARRGRIESLARGVGGQGRRKKRVHNYCSDLWKERGRACWMSVECLAA